jgi:tRNA modification GTPase
MNEDTIFAVASGVGRAAIAILRISGPEAGLVWRAMAGGLPPARQARYVHLRDRPGGNSLDRCLALWFPGPASFTGEDCVEFHLHGGRAVVAGVVKALDRIAGCRPAVAGEFTRRAFLNGKLDLSEVEGLADLINAETEAQRVQALRQLSGQLGRSAEAWRRRLVEALAAVEAEIDFSDEADVGGGGVARACRIAAAVGAEIAAALDDGQRGERLREGYMVVIAGAPNSGKSTLLNALARRDAAIVSPYEGTTRDVIEVHLDLQGLPVMLVDTAGWRETADPVEATGIQRGRDRAAAADLLLLLRRHGDAAMPSVAGAEQLRIMTMADLRCGAGSNSEMPQALPGGDRACGAAPEGQEASEGLAVSALTGFGIDALLDEIARRAHRTLAGGHAIITRDRHRRALQEAWASLRRLNESAPVELVAEDLRRAALSLAAVAGRIGAEDILDEIFASFCIGK